MKILTTIARLLFILCLPFLLLTASIAWAVNSQWLYEYGFEKYNISQITGLAQPELQKAAAGLISYFNSDEEFISLSVIKDGQPFTLFNQREVAHLKDVKGLFWLDYRVALVTLLYALSFAGVCLFWLKDRRLLARGLFFGGGLTLALLLTLGLAALLDFNQFFLEFHLLSFSNDFWLLDPSRDYLVMLFPQGFWFDVTLFCALATAAAAIALGWTGFALLRRSPPLNKPNVQG